jgi:thymidine phosphorylase
MPTKYTLHARRLGIDTYQEPVIYMRSDCHVCRSEGFSSRTRVQVSHPKRTIIATLDVVTGDLLAKSQAGLSEAAWALLEIEEGAELSVSHAPPLESFSQVRGKLYGNRLEEAAFDAIVADVVAGRYSDVQISAFLAACSAQSLDHAETLALTRAMVRAGQRIDWGKAPIADKHSIGGLPGNRTTPIVVAIVAEAGLTIPKTSSRAITSPAGTADTMEMLAPVELSLRDMRRVVERHGGCVVWGGSVRLSPADDLLIRVERALDLDSEGQLVASVLSKKAAAGSTHVVLDLPVGPTAKLRSAQAARAIGGHLCAVARALGIAAEVAVGDGTQPIGRGIGPALEARDVLGVLRCEPAAPADLRDRALVLAQKVIELAGGARHDDAHRLASDILRSGRALRRFEAICEAQGGMRVPPVARHTRPILAERSGTVTAMDTRRMARAAKLAGAPQDPAAGIDLHVRLAQQVEAAQPLFTLHAETPGELDYALDYVRANAAIVYIGDRP